MGHLDLWTTPTFDLSRVKAQSHACDEHLQSDDRTFQSMPHAPIRRSVIALGDCAENPAETTGNLV
jgi:hypothetical protein